MQLRDDPLSLSAKSSAKHVHAPSRHQWVKKCLSHGKLFARNKWTFTKGTSPNFASNTRRIQVNQPTSIPF